VSLCFLTRARNCEHLYLDAATENLILDLVAVF